MESKIFTVVNKHTYEHSTMLACKVHDGHDLRIVARALKIPECDVNSNILLVDIANNQCELHTVNWITHTCLSHTPVPARYIIIAHSYLIENFDLIMDGDELRVDVEDATIEIIHKPATTSVDTVL